MLKKFILIILVLVTLTIGIGMLTKNKNVTIIDENDIIKVAYDDVPWEEDVGDFTNEVEISPETAMRIGELLLLQDNPSALDDKPSRSIEKIIDKDIYIVTYSKGDEWVGGCYSIAINYKTCEILKIWAGE